MTQWTIESMHPALDLDGVLEVDQASFVSGWTRQMYQSELEHSDVSRIYVLRTAEERVAAFCSCWFVFDELHVNNLAVRPAYRGLGMATALMIFVLQEASARGLRRATLEVRQSNDAARRLYDRLGFQVVGVRKGYYRNPEEDALILWRDTRSPGPAVEALE